jgi:amidase
LPVKYPANFHLHKGILYQKGPRCLKSSIGRLKQRGAEIIEIEEVVQDKAGQQSFQIMLFEYKDGLNKYFESLGPSAPLKNLEDFIAFNISDSIELKYFNQKYLEMAQDKDTLSSEVYKKALAERQREARKTELIK